MITQGQVLVMQGDKEAIAQVRHGITAKEGTGARTRAHTSCRLAELYLVMGQAEEARHVVTEGLVMSEQTGERWYDAELHRLRGEALLALSGEHDTEAERCFYQALEVSRSQQAKSWELRAAMSLSRLWQQQGQGMQAQQQLAPIYDWFTEGFSTQDLKDAKMLLEELSR